MTDQDIRSELKKLYISLAFISSGSNILGGLFNSDAEEQDSSAVSKEMMYLYLKLFLLYVANGNSRITARQFAYIDDMVDHEMIRVKMTASDLMARMPAFDEDPPYPREIMDALIQKDLMSKWIRPDEKPEEVTRCVRVYLELGRGVISLDENTASTQRYRDFMQATCRYAIRSGNGNYTAADFAFVYEALESLSAANVAGTASSAKVKAPAGKSMVGCVRAACVEGGNAFLYRVETQVLPGSGEYDFNGPVPENILHRVMQTAIKNLIFHGSNFLNSIDSTKDYYVNIIAPNSTLPDLPAELAAMLSFHSAISGQPVSQDLIVLGSIDMDGALVAPKEVDKLLRLCAEAGAKRVLLPVNTAASIKEIPSEFKLIYFSTPQEALSKAFESETTPAAVAKKAPAKKSTPKKTTTTQKKSAPSTNTPATKNTASSPKTAAKSKAAKAVKKTDAKKDDAKETKAKKVDAKKAEPPAEIAGADGYVIVGTGREKIQQRAFNNRADLEKVEVAEGVERINSYAFRNCSNLKEIRLPSSLRIIQRNAFYQSGIVEIVLPEGMQELTLDAFYRAHELRRILAPDTIASIEENSWSTLDKLEHFEYIRLPRAFAEKAAHKNLKMQECIDLIRLRDVDDAEKNRIIRCVEDDGTLRLIDATEIQAHEYDSRNDLERVVVPNGVTKIGEFAFFGCDRLSEVVLPASLTEIGVDAFAYCYKLQRIALPAGLIRIGEYAFAFNSDLQGITWPSGLLEIGVGAMFGCKKLKRVELPPRLREIGDYCFQKCEALTDVVIPASVEHVGEEILQEVMAPIHITFLGTPARIDGDLFGESSEHVASIRIPQAFYDRYKNTDWLQKYAGGHSLDGSYTSLGKIVITDPRPAAPAPTPRPSKSAGFGSVGAEKPDPNADRRKQLEAQIRSLEAERDAIRGIFGGIKRRKLQKQIDELQAELRRLS